MVGIDGVEPISDSIVDMIVLHSDHECHRLIAHRTDLPEFAYQILASHGDYEIYEMLYRNRGTPPDVTRRIISTPLFVQYLENVEALRQWRSQMAFDYNM